jgi:hypothetical protein
MATTITLSLGVASSGSEGVDVSDPTRSAAIVITGTPDGIKKYQSIATAETTIDFDGVSPGVVILWNMDPTNYVDVGFTTGNLDARLLPNRGAPFVCLLNAGESLIAQANTAACQIAIIAFEL